MTGRFRLYAAAGLAVVLAGCATAPAPIGGSSNGDSEHQAFIARERLPGSTGISEHGLSGLYTRVVVSAVNRGTEDPFLPFAFAPDTDQQPYLNRRASCPEAVRPGVGATLPEVDSRCDARTADAEEQGRDYARESRFWWQRWFLGRVNTKTALLHVGISTPEINTTSTLAAFTHESTRANGEQFSTEIRHHSVATPFFRIEPDATVDLRLELDLGYSTSSDTIAATLSTATTALSVLGPSTQLLTSLNREEVNQAAQFFDTTVSAVLSEDLTEVMRVTNGIEDWLMGQRAEFTIQVPDHSARRLAEISNDHTDPVGSWRVELDLPRISIWSDYSPCWRLSSTMVCPDTFPFEDMTLERRAQALGNTLRYLTPARVLQFSVTDTTTLGAHVRDQAWYTSAVSAINSSTGTADDIEARTASFCRQVMRTAVETGFNTLDSHIVLWAVLGSAEVTPGARTRAYAGGCSDEHALIEQLNL